MRYIGWKQIQGKLSYDRFGDIGKRTDEKNRNITGKLKNPFDQRKEGDKHNRNIPKMSLREFQVAKSPNKI